MTIREKVTQAIEADVRVHWLGRDTTQAFIDHTITAVLEAAAEEGWHMRPDEPDAEMTHAAWQGRYKVETALSNEGIYRAMLAAAPEFKWDK